MKNWQEYFAGKKVTVMRIGLLGRGIGDAAFLSEMGAEVLVVDDAPQEVMQPAVDALSGYENISYKFGAYDTADFVSADYVLVGAGAPMDMEVLHAAKKAGVPLKQSAAWFAELSGVPIIGVTGTRGKSTVTHMIHHCLTQITGEDVLLGGNVRGLSNLQLLKDVQEYSLCVMELDSWQLQGWGWQEMSPQIAVFTNFMNDHMNYYLQAADGDEAVALDLYFADKANIFRYQEESGVLITTPEVFARAKTLPGVTLGQEVILADASTITEDMILPMPGVHNRLNAALATEALQALSLSEDEIYEALATFPGVEGRLQNMGEVDGVRIYNDNNATTPAATVAGINAVVGATGGKNIVLIAGGADKALDPAPLVDAIKTYTKHVVLLRGTGTDRIKDQIECDVVDSMGGAVEAALRAASTGDIILFSPGFASFGMYKNEYERNDVFVKIVTKSMENDRTI